MRLQKYVSILVLLFALTFSYLSTTASSQVSPVRDIAIILEMGEGDIASYYLEGETAVPLEAINSPDIVPMPPFPSYIAYQSLNNNNWDIYRIRFDSGADPTRLTTSPAVDSFPSLRNGANWLVFVSNRDGDDDIYRLDILNNSLLNISLSSSDDLNPSWSPDGTKIAFNSYRTGNSEIFVSNSDGSNLRQLTNHPAYDGQPSWSPDGSRIVFSSSRSGTYQLWVMNADGSNPHQLTFGANALYPSWSPTGTTIAYTSDSNYDGWFELWLVDANGTNPRQHLAGQVLQDYWLPDWSPDGNAIALTSTAWVYQNGQFYWTTSGTILVDPLVPNLISTSFHAPNSFRPSWAAGDDSPPAACVIQTNSLQHDRTFVLAWTATDVGDAGVGSYDVETRLNAASPWQRVASSATQTSIRYDYAQDGSRQFRCRAWDRAFNLGAWGTPKTITVDTIWPDSSVMPLAPYSREPVIVQWTGNGGNLTYDVYVREGTVGNWQLWQNGVSTTSALFSGDEGQTYYFRSQARDGRQLEPWQAKPDTAVTFYAQRVSGFVNDNRGYPIAEPAIGITPLSLGSVQNALTGAYELFVGDPISYTLDFTATGYGSLPPTTVSLSSDLTLNAVLPPVDDAIINGGFEDGTLNGWVVTGSSATATENAHHTGAYGLNISHTAITETVVAQTIAVETGWVNPTLAFLYHISHPLTGGGFRVQISDATNTTTVLNTSQSTSTWQHVWADLTAYSGQTITITLAADHAVGDIRVDEVSLGSWQTPHITAVSPTEWRYKQAITLNITGANFLDTPTVFLDQIALSNVTWLNNSQLEIAVPTTIPEGIYTVTVINPGGAKAVAPQIITIAQERIFLPLVVKPGYAPQPTADWLTLGYDAAHTAYNIIDPGASRYHLRWSKTLPFPGGTPLQNIAVSNNIVVATSEVPNQSSAVVALDLETGAEKWRQVMDGDSVSPPTIAQGVVYVVQNTRGAYGLYVSVMYAFDLITGTELWRVPFATFYSQSLLFHQPVFAEGRLFVGGHGFYAFDAFTGQKLWQGAGGSPLWVPAYRNGAVYSWNDYYFYSFPANSNAYSWYADITEGPFTTLITDNRAILSSQTKLVGINLNTHTIAWSQNGNYARNLAAVADNVLYSLNGSMLEARNPANGALLWHYDTNAMLVNAPVVAGNYVYVTSGAETFVINRSTHQLESSIDKGGWLAVANGHLFVADDDKTIYAYRAQEP